MSALRPLILALVGASLFSNEARADALTGLVFDKPVIDQANLISSSGETNINELLREVRAQGGPHIGVITIPSLEGDTIEGISIRIAELWQLGSAEKDNGIIITIAEFWINRAWRSPYRAIDLFG